MPKILRFDCFEVDLDSCQLRKRGTRIKLRDQSFQVLASLLEEPGRTVTREELCQRLWHDEVFVDFDNNLNIVIARLRQALGDSAEHPHFIETLPKRGYRFLATVSEPVYATRTARHVRLLVLPVVNVTGDPAREYLGDALTEELITELASLAPEQLAVIARTTAMHYKGSHKDIARIGRELGVDYVVEGSVRGTEDDVAINVQLIEASDQVHVFARRYVAPLRDVFHVQRDIALAIVSHIPAIADGTHAGVSIVSTGLRKPAEDLAAYNEYIQGRSHLARATPEAMEIARQHLERAIARDSDFALAYDALAELCWYKGYFGYWPPREAFAAGIVHALRALEIDGTRAETHALLGQFHKTVEYNWSEVHREMALARRLDSNSPLVRMRYAVSELMPHGHLEAAVVELEGALEFDPLAAFPRFWLGIVLVLSRRHERAIAEAQKLLEVDPVYFPAHFILAVGYRLQGRIEEALAAQRRAIELSGAPFMSGWLGLTLAGSGRVVEAREVLHGLHAMARDRYVPPTSFAWIHLGLGELDTAFEWLNRAVDECDQLMMPIKSYGFFDQIRSDPRFTMLLRKMNLEE